MFHCPEIPGNTGNAIRLAAITGARLHLVEPLGFGFEDAHLRRAGLDYHDLAVMQTHPDFASALEAVPGARVFAFTARGRRRYDEVDYAPSDVLLFGQESTGLPDQVLAHPRITDTVRLPMQPARRSLNLANAASIVIFEAWRQHDFSGAQLLD
ncbi:MAG: tRNA (cytidine(34)-2'-O)-methyltransferase [Micrococcus sp.]|nr:tRNA (cytidine(34)-2'-O)-methyltransferase [Micrococcus sp.]